MSSLSSFVKRLRDIMRNDAGINGDAQRIEQIAWMLFLKVYDSKEQDWDMDEEHYQSIIPEECRWSNWAVDDKSGSAMTGDTLLNFVNNTLFPTLKGLNVTPETPIKKSIVKTTFEDANNYMKDGVLLRQVLNIIDELDLSDYEESHAFGEIYESILRELQSAGSAGEFYTPRAVTEFMAQMIQPKIGETMADFACGTGGFITSWLNQLAPQIKTTDDQTAYDNSIYGIEKKQFPYMLCITNMLLHGLDVPRVYHDNSLLRDVLDYTEDDQFDVVLMNPPYGGSEKADVKNHFPSDLASSETADLFMSVIMYRLKKNGRAAVILPDGFLFGTDNAKLAIKKKLFSEFNLHTIIRMISYYRERTVELDKVLNIFIRVNSGGTKLSYSDLLLSIASAQWETHDAREEITDFVDDVNAIGDGFRINKDFVLKTALVLSDFSNIAFKVDNFNKQNMMKIESRWDDIKKAIKQAVLLVSSYGYSGETLTSNNALIPIAYYLMKIGMPDNFVDSGTTKANREKIKKWLIRSLLKKAFSGQPDNVLRPIRDILRGNGTNDFPTDQIMDKFKGTNKSIQFAEDDIDEYLLKLKYGKSETLSTLMLLYPSLDFSNKFHEDHMYPKSKFTKSYLRKMNVAEDKLDEYIDSVNDISNLQLLAAQLNEEKLATDFAKWFNSQYLTESDKIQYRTINYMPDMDYTYENYSAFMKERRKLLKAQLIKILL